MEKRFSNSGAGENFRIRYLENVWGEVGKFWGMGIGRAALYNKVCWEVFNLTRKEVVEHWKDSQELY